MYPEGVVNLLKAESKLYAYSKANPNSTIKERTTALLEYCTSENIGFRGFTYLERRLILGKRA